MASVTNQMEYLSLNTPQRILYRISHFFTGIPSAVASKAKTIPGKCKAQYRKGEGIVKSIISAGRDGDLFTRLSFLVMGCGLFTRHQIIRGSLYLLYELFFIVFFVIIGVPNLRALPSLGQLASAEYTSLAPDGSEVTLTVSYDDSFTILLYSLVTITLMVIFIFLWYNQLKDSLVLQRMSYIGRKRSDSETLKNVFDKSYDKTLLFVPISGLVLFTIIPIIMMILIGFTDYNSAHTPPTSLFDWVGWYNFAGIFSTSSSASGGNFLKVFGEVLLWTLCWAFFSTFSNYFLGMIMAMIINTKGIKLKKLWRTILITTIAVPQFISLLLISKMFANDGFVNSAMISAGWIKTYIPFLSDAMLAKVMIIVLNTWVGIPYTMLICTGLLMNIPADLYESARIDGASPARMYFKITLPYMLFVTTPYLISQFVGNINNFNVIYFLSGGAPVYGLGAGVPVSVISAGLGQTDLLITWLYKMTVTSATKDYGTASVIGLLIFVVVAFFSLIFYNNSKSVQDEEEFQ